VYIGDIVITPENALLSQARNACYHPGMSGIITCDLVVNTCNRCSRSIW
jgi:hypothetical protein